MAVKTPRRCWRSSEAVQHTPSDGPALIREIFGNPFRNQGRPFRIREDFSCALEVTGADTGPGRRVGGAWEDAYVEPGRREGPAAR